MTRPRFEKHGIGTEAFEIALIGRNEACVVARTVIDADRPILRLVTSSERAMDLFVRKG
jgi:hypothetical protein